MHQLSNPSILYFGTPVVLIGTTNCDDTFNLAPISSAFRLGYRCMIGIATHSKFVALHPFAAEAGIENIRSVTMELKIVRVHLDDSILSDQKPTM